MKTSSVFILVCVVFSLSFLVGWTSGLVFMGNAMKASAVKAGVGEWASNPKTGDVWFVWKEGE